MQDERELAETLVGADFFGADGLSDEGPPPAPDKYVVERSLGRGGSGSVYLARDVSLGRPVALKYLSHARPAEVERFFREARFAARLRNPAIVQIYEAGEIDGLPFIAMQYIPGGNLAGARLEAAGTVRVLRQVAEALAHAHGEGIVHRDIKPENILLDEAGRAYVSDFGIARDLRGELGATISQDGQILGTPCLMSPEQARGDLRAIDARTDVYALGATLYLTLTGREPFRGESLVDVLHAVIHDEPAFPRAHRPDIPRDLEAVILRCMRKRRSERYGSMREVIEAFDRHLTGADPGALSPVWFTTYVRRRVEDAPAAPPDDPGTERDWLPALEVAQEIAAWDTQLYRVRSDLQRYFPRLDALIARLTAVLDERPATGWARFYRGVAWFRRGELGRALEDMERSIDRVADLAGAYFELGRLYLALYLDEHQRAHAHISRVGTEDSLRQARTRLEQAGLAFAEARRLKPDLPAWQWLYAEAVRQLAGTDDRGCVGTCERILADEPDLEEVWKLKGDALRRLGEDPMPAYERALEIRRSYYQVLLAIADRHLDTGALEQARAALTRALAVHDHLHPARVLMARTYLDEWRAGGSTDVLRTGQELAAAVFEQAPDRYDIAVTLAELQIETARATGDAEWIARALASLEAAAGLDGCLNRVGLLRATARLAGARLALAAGQDVRAELDAILALRHEDGARVPDNAPWLALFAEASEMLNAECGINREFGIRNWEEWGTEEFLNSPVPQSSAFPIRHSHIIPHSPFRHSELIPHSPFRTPRFFRPAAPRPGRAAARAAAPRAAPRTTARWPRRGRRSTPRTPAAPRAR